MNMPKRALNKNFSYAQILAIGLAYFLVAVVSIYFSRGADTVAHFWYANAVGIAFLLHSKQARRWHLLGVLAITNVLANWAFDSSLVFAGTFVIPNMLEMVVATLVANHFQIERDFDQTPQNMLRFVLLVCLFSSGLGALTGASILSFLGFSPFLQVLPLWFVSSSVGTLALLPLMLVVMREPAENLLKFQSVNLSASATRISTPGAESGASSNAPLHTLFFYIFVVCSVSYLTLSYLPFPFIYLVIPLIFATIQTDTKTVTLLVFLLSLVIGTVNHLGLFEPGLKTANELKFLNYLPILITFLPVFILIASMNLIRNQNRKKGEVEEALRRKHFELQMIVDNVPAFIGFWDANLRNVFANRMYFSYFGWTPEDMLGKHVSEVVGASLYAQNLPYMEAALRGEAQMFERTIIGPDGTSRESLTSYVPSYRDGEMTGVFVFITDITDIKKARQAESVAEARLQSVIDSATEFSIISTDEHGILRLFSKGAEKMLGYSSSEFVHQQSPAILHLPEEVMFRAKELSTELQREISGFETFVAKAKLGFNDTREWTYVHKSGRKIPVRLVVTAIFDSNKNITGYLGIANDISDEKELQQLLINAKDSAEQTSKAKSDFVANMSHEIRTPMNAVLGMSQLLAATNLSSEQRKYLEMIKISGQSLLGILNDILDFSKIEANRLEISHNEFLLDDVLGALASMMAVSVGDKDIELAIGVDLGVPKRLMGDQLRLQQILTNLTGNSLKFTSQGEIAVFVDALPGDSADDSSTDKNRIKLRFSVRDTGIGMDEQQLQKLFRPFSQADASTTRRFGGTGLGLSISKSILDLMGGQISVSSQLGQGSEFQIVVPLTSLDSPLREQNSASEKQLKILVVDDNLTSNNYICRTIRSWNWLVESATSGQQALDIVKARSAAQVFFDVIIVDWQMPEMDGLSAIERLREIVPKKLSSFIIMVGAFNRDRMLQQQITAQADAILMKPITGSSMLDTVHEAIALNANSVSKLIHSKVLPQRPDNIRGIKFLLAEDNPFNQIVAKGFIEQAGATVDIVENGLLAVERLRSQAANYDVVLMDVQMPILDGISATKIIRNELRLDLPIIAMSAGVMLSERDRCMQSGMNDFVAKPIDVEQMFAVIARYAPPARATENVADEIAASPVTQAPAITLEKTQDEFFNPGPFEKLAQAAPASLGKILQSMQGVAEQASVHWQNVQAAIGSQRWEEAARILHTLRGSVGSLGAKSFAAMTLQIENLIKDGQHADLDQLLQQAESDLQQTLTLARAWLAQHEVQHETQHKVQQAAKADATLPDAKLKLDPAALAQLKQLLSENNLQACDVFEDLRPTLQAQLSDDRVQQLAAAIQLLDFKAALQVLADIV